MSFGRISYENLLCAILYLTIYPVQEVLEQVLSKVFRGISEKELSQSMNLLRRVLANAQEESLK